MKFVIQRCQEASVSVDGKTVGAIEKGLMVLIGVGKDDTTEVVDKYLKKLLQLRIFEDENGRMNLSAADIGGGVLVVSQFTLAADCTSGSRPSFSNGASPAEAQKAYLAYVEALCAEGLKVETGSFGAHMHVRLTNDGPATFWLKF